MAFQMPTLLPHQQVAKDFMVQHPHCGIFLDIGGMKAQPLSALVLTPTGFIPMGQVTPGTVVVTPDGTHAPVRSVHPQGMRPIATMMLADGRRIQADPEHLWVVANGTDRYRGRTKVMTTAQIAADLRASNGSPKWAIQAIIPADLGEWSSVLDPYLLGLLLGDGGFTQSPPMFSNPDDEIVGTLADLLPIGMTVKPTHPGSIDHRLSTADDHLGRNNVLTDELRRLGLYGCGSGEKFVPAALLHSSVADRHALLQGLADTNASIHGSNFVFDLKSQQLAKDAAWLVHSLGGRASVRELTLRTGPYAGNRYYRIIAQLPNSLPPFRASSRASRWRPHNEGHRRSYDPAFVSITDIELSDTETEMQCISIDHPDQQYVTDGFVRTHNTLSTLAALFEARPAGHILVIAPLAIARSTWLDEIEKWGIPLRTKSLIVDENDRQLTKEARLQRFADVFTDPPTMYFINREMLTQPSNAVNKLVVSGSGAARTADQIRILDVLSTTGGLPTEDLIDHIRDEDAASGSKPTTKKALNEAIKQVMTDGLVERRRFDCEGCQGRGCPECSFGLIDQMPVVRKNGRDVIQWPFATVIIDESQGFKDSTSNRFKALKRVRPAIERLIELTGTPTPQSLLDIWAQMYLLDQGKTLGSYTAFRAKHFIPTAHIDGRPIKWQILPGAEAQIYQAIAPYVMSARNVSLQLPPVTRTQVNITLPKDVMTAYRDFARDQVLLLAMPDPKDPRRITITADNAAILHGKLVQFASGTIYLDEDRNHTVIHREKLEMLEHLISNASGSVLVAYRYVSEKQEILAYLAKRGHAVEAFDGSRDMVRRWNAQQIPVMVVHPASAGPGLNLQDGGHTLIWHTLPDPLEHYQQLNGRLARPGQANPVTIYELVTKATRDAALPGKLAIKAKVQQGLIDAVEIDVFDVLRDLDQIFDFGDLGDLDINPL